MKGKVVVAMSGGVDSSVAAALLKHQGYEVTGMMLRLWTEPGRESANRCCTPAAMGLARRVAAQLDIPFYVVDAKDAFHEEVVSYFVQEYGRGVTPNPCLICNRHIRWEFLLNRALAIGADYMATGHYARIQHFPGRPARLLRGRDAFKDQSYVLHTLEQEQLAHALFPVGDYTKSEIRALAAEFNLPVAKVKDSQDLCFLAGTNHTEFLQRNAPEVLQPGPIADTAGNLLGQHNGLPQYTIGQRKGLGVSSPVPLFVIEKKPQTNTLIVGPAEALGNVQIQFNHFKWLNTPPQMEFRAEVKTRYTGSLLPGTVFIHGDNSVMIELDEPARDITPGQAAVIYLKDEVLGGGLIGTAQLPSATFRPVQLAQTT